MKVKDLFRNRKFNTDLSEEEILNEFEKYIKLKNFLKKDEEFELYQKPSLVAKINMEQLEKFKEDYKILLTKYKNDNIEDNIGLDILMFAFDGVMKDIFNTDDPEESFRVLNIIEGIIESKDKLMGDILMVKILKKELRKKINKKWWKL